MEHMTAASNDPAAIGARMDELCWSIAARRDSREANGVEVRMRSVPTGFACLDDLLGGGLRPGSLTILAGRPAVGASSLALQMALTAAQTGAFTLFLCFNFAPEYGAERLLALESGVNPWRLHTGKVNDAEWTCVMETTERLAQASLFIDDGPATMRFLDRRIEELAGSPLPERGIVFVDDIVHAAAKMGFGGSPAQTNAELTRDMKLLAMRLKMPVVVLGSLVSDAIRERTDPTPELWDLRELGSVEQDADNVLFLDRSITEDEADLEGRPALGEARLILAKHRYGPIGAFSVAYDARTGRFADPQA